MTDNRADASTRDTNSRELSGAYALDAVTPDEAAEFEQAAGASAALQAESDSLRETAGLLGLAATPVAPSVRLKLDLMAQIAVTPQLGAGAPDDAAAVVTASAVAPDSVRAPAAAPAAAPAEVPAQPATPAPAPAPAEARAQARWFTRPSRILIAAAAAIALFVGGGIVGSLVSNTSGPSATDASAAALADILAASDTQRASAPIEVGGTATLVWSNTLGRSAMIVDDLPELPTGKVYEAWYIDESGSAAAAGTFTSAEGGITLHVLDGTMAARDAVGVTVEPKGGSEQPTTDPILVLQSS